MISSRSVCRTDHHKSEHFRKIGASGSPAITPSIGAALVASFLPALQVKWRALQVKLHTRKNNENNSDLEPSSQKSLFSRISAFQDLCSPWLILCRSTLPYMYHVHVHVYDYWTHTNTTQSDNAQQRAEHRVRCTVTKYSVSCNELSMSRSCAEVHTILATLSAVLTRQTLRKCWPTVHKGTTFGQQ